MLRERRRRPAMCKQRDARSILRERAFDRVAEAGDRKADSMMTKRLVLLKVISWIS